MDAQGEKIWDRIALLQLLDETNKIGQIEGNLKLQKLAFLSELQGLTEPLVPLYFRFFRYTLGPYSAELAKEVRELESGAFITSTTRRLTKRGQYVLEYVADAVQGSPEARKAMEIIHTVARQHGRRSGNHLKNLVYGLKVPVHDLGGKVVRVKDIPSFFDILNPRLRKVTREVQPLSGQVIQDLMEEFTIPPADLSPKSVLHKQIISSALRRIIQEFHPTS